METPSPNDDHIFSEPLEDNNMLVSKEMIMALVSGDIKGRKASLLLKQIQECPLSFAYYQKINRFVNDLTSDRDKMISRLQGSPISRFALGNYAVSGHKNSASSSRIFIIFSAVIILAFVVFNTFFSKETMKESLKPVSLYGVRYIKEKITKKISIKETLKPSDHLLIDISKTKKYVYYWGASLQGKLHFTSFKDEILQPELNSTDWGIEFSEDQAVEILINKPLADTKKIFVLMSNQTLKIPFHVVKEATELLALFSEKSAKSVLSLGKEVTVVQFELNVSNED